MPRPAKGSPEAIEWAKKMKAARDAKKGMTGGSTGKRKADSSPPKEVPKMTAPTGELPTMVSFQPASTAIARPVARRPVPQQPQPQQPTGGKIRMPKMSKTTKKLVGAITDVAKKVGTKAGKPFEATAGVNPFTLGYDLGYNVIGPAVVGKGVPPPSRLPDVSPEAELMAGAGIKCDCCKMCGGAIVYI